MIHEVMILDHSGPELAALQYTAAMKLTICASLVATVLNPVPAQRGMATVALANIGLTLAVAIVIACVESLIARLRLKAVPQYVFVALVAAVVALLTTVWRQGGPS
jgi:formate hydrogenlyase subunit 4